MHHGSGGDPYQQFETLPFALGVVRDSRLIFANTALLGLLGLRREEVIGRSLELLSPAQLVLETHSGRITVESPPSGGTTFQLLLPLCPESLAAQVG